MMVIAVVVSLAAFIILFETRTTVNAKETPSHHVYVADTPNPSVVITEVDGHRFAVAVSYRGVAICEVTEASSTKR